MRKKERGYYVESRKCVWESLWKEHGGRLGILKSNSVVRREDSLSIPGEDADIKKIRVGLGDINAKHRSIGVTDIQQFVVLWDLTGASRPDLLGEIHV